VSVGKRPRLCTLGEPVQPPPTPPNDRPLPEKPDHRPHVTTQILGEWYSALVDTGAAGSFIGDSLRDKCYRHLRPVTPTIQSARMANGQVDTITEAYWISLKIGTRTIQGKFHHLPHLPSDLVLGIDVLRQYPFSIDLKGGSASLRSPAAVDVVQPTPTHPASQVSNSPPLILSPDEDQRLRQFLSEELPLVDTVPGLTPLAQHEIRLLHPEPVKQHDFDIRYRKGVLNRVADALSRQPATAKDETTPEGLFTLEGATGCSWYTKMRREVEKNPAAYPDYCIHGDRLHRHFWDMSDSTEPELSDPWKLCVPKPARAAVLKECHDNPTAGHLGIAKTTARLALWYYWPGMFREAAQYVRKCPSCQRYKTPQQQPPGKMYPTPNRQPWETVSTDLVGPLPRSSRGNCYVVVMQDRFTKWVQCRAVRKATAAKRSAERPPAAKPKTGRPGRPPERSTAGRPQDPGAVPTSTAESPGREDGDPDHPERPERACSATAGPDASGLNCQRGSLLAPADRNPIDLDASVALNLDHRRPSRNHCSRHHGVANTGELPTRRPARADTGGPPKTPTVYPRDASPTAPPAKNEASAHGGTRAPVCPARWDATGSRKHDREPGTRRPPPLKPGHHRQQEDTFNLTRFSKKPF
jgi:hypothetical protein